MQRITAFIYQNRIEVLADIDPSLTTRNKIVYARTIKIYRGMDNTVVFQLKNSDQKPINISNYSVTMSIVNDDNNTQFVEFEGTIVDATKGLVSVIVPEQDLAYLDREFYNYALKVTDQNDLEITVYTDDFFTVRGQIQVLDGYNAAFQPSKNLSLTNLTENVVVTSAISGNYPSGYNLWHSFQFYFDNFTGQVIAQVTTEPINTIVEGDWMTYSTTNYTSQTDTALITVEGPYTAIRFRILETTGEVTKILARS